MSPLPNKIKTGRGVTFSREHFPQFVQDQGSPVIEVKRERISSQGTATDFQVIGSTNECGQLPLWCLCL